MSSSFNFRSHHGNGPLVDSGPTQYIEKCERAFARRLTYLYKLQQISPTAYFDHYPNMSFEEIEEQRRSSRRWENMSFEELEDQRRSSRRIWENMSFEEIEEQRRSRRRLENMSFEEIEEQRRSRRRWEYMSFEEIEEQRRSRRRWEYMSFEEIEEQRRSRRRWEYMSFEEIEELCRSSRRSWANYNIELKKDKSWYGVVDAVEKLATITVNGESSLMNNNDSLSSSSECPICLKEFEVGKDVKQMPCLHLFHSNCLFLWLEKQNNTCPVCRAQIDIDRSERDDFEE